eukprot:TRINITY_DN30068_c0_g1_i1.p1 TRINITY_DN30068_c0_g1~~TRINITY_DN30068_c0_g1_i1.p1  ORF type:complete len:139 (+),score=34.76 TRINITY_DN30068_c0_g1_i1:54-470(+)
MYETPAYVAWMGEERTITTGLLVPESKVLGKTRAARSTKISKWNALINREMAELDHPEKIEVEDGAKPKKKGVKKAGKAAAKPAAKEEVPEALPEPPVQEEVPEASPEEVNEKEAPEQAEEAKEAEAEAEPEQAEEES